MSLVVGNLENIRVTLGHFNDRFDDHSNVDQVGVGGRVEIETEPKQYIVNQLRAFERDRPLTKRIFLEAQNARQNNAQVFGDRIIGPHV